MTILYLSVSLSLFFSFSLSLSLSISLYLSLSGPDVTFICQSGCSRQRSAATRRFAREQSFSIFSRLQSFACREIQIQFVFSVLRRCCAILALLFHCTGECAQLSLKLFCVFSMFERKKIVHSFCFLISHMSKMLKLQFRVVAQARCRSTCNLFFVLFM